MCGTEEGEVERKVCEMSERLPTFYQSQLIMTQKSALCFNPLYLASDFSSSLAQAHTLWHELASD